MAGRSWNLREIEHLKAHYSDTPTHKIAADLGRTEKQVYMKVVHLNKTENAGLSKSHEYLTGPLSGRLRPGTNIGGRSRFTKGHQTWNAGMKGWQPNNYETRFKSGNRQGHVLQVIRAIGDERRDKDGYLERKVSDTGKKRKDWRKAHVLLWEQHYGPTPPDHIVVFRDGRKNNIVIENLELITRQELIQRNTVHRFPKEIVIVCRLKAKLQREINKRAEP